MPNLFDYKDSRDYLKMCFGERKQLNPQYSYEAFTQRLGFSNRGFLFNVLKGKKNLSISHCIKISRALKHSKEEAEYFEKIVAYTQAKNEEERTYILEKMQPPRKTKGITPLLIEKEQYEYLSKWYHSAVRCLIEMYPTSDDCDFISRRIFPPITAMQAKKSIELLKRLDIIRKGNDGIYHCTGRNIRASDEISQRAINRFHVECTELAKQSVMYSASKRHFVSSLTMGISEKAYNDIRDESMKFKQRVLEIANSDEAADRVYQYQLVMFPLTTDPDNKEAGK
jgi:uncharacterized protein (TIGR02147 family)